MQQATQVLDAALRYHDAEFSIIPVKLDGTKSPAIPTWEPFQHKRADVDTLSAWFIDPKGIGAVCGDVSNQFEVIDIDSAELYDPFIKRVEEQNGGDLIRRLCIIKSPRPGFQLWYRCPSGIEGSQKLAQRRLPGEKHKTLIETKGEGGYVVSVGSAPGVHPAGTAYAVVQGDQFNPPEISSEERALLISCARTFDEIGLDTFLKVESSLDQKYRHGAEEYGRNTDWEDILKPAGFKLLKESDGVGYWQKPHSSNPGHHVTTNYAGQDLLRCFSDSCPPFDSKKSYCKFEVHALLEHDGDLGAAFLSLLNEGHAWKEEKPLMRQMPAATPFPTDALGPVLGAAAKEIQRVVQAPAAICGQSILAAACLAVQPHSNVIIDGRVSPVSNFFLTVADSGERKSAVDKIAIKPHREFQKSLRIAYEAERLDYDDNLSLYEATRNRILKDKKASIEEKKSMLADLGPPPVPPLEPNVLVDEPTYEGLVKALAVGQGSMGVFSDEGGRFIGGHAMNEENILKTAAGLSSLWDGSDTSRSRAGEGTFTLCGRRVALHLMVQPKVAGVLLSNQVLVAQGLMSRCLVSCPDSAAGERKYVESDLTTCSTIQKYSERILEILMTAPQTAEGKRNELMPRNLPLSAEAKKVWIDYHNKIEKQLGEGGRLKPIIGFANKVPEHAARLAAVLSLFDDLDCSSVATKYVDAAIALMEHYIGEALRLFYLGLLDEQLVLAATLLEWLQKRGENTVSLVDIYQKGPNAIRQASKARQLMHILNDHGWVIPLPDGIILDSQKRREMFAVKIHQNGD